MPRKKKMEKEDVKPLKKKAVRKAADDDVDTDEEEVEVDATLAGDEEPEVEPSVDEIKAMEGMEEFDDIIEKRTAGKGRKASSKDEYDEEDFEEFDDFGEDDEEGGGVEKLDDDY